MTYSILLLASDVRFSAKQLPELRKAFQEIDKVRGTEPRLPYAIPLPAELLKEESWTAEKAVATVETLFSTFRYGIEYRKDEYFYITDYFRDCWGEEIDSLWKYLAPLVQDGAVLYWKGTDDDQEYRFIFRDGLVEKQRGLVVYEPTPGATVSLSQIVDDFYDRDPVRYHRRVLGISQDDWESVKSGVDRRLQQLADYPRGVDAEIDELLLKKNLQVEQAFQFFANRRRRQLRDKP